MIGSTEKPCCADEERVFVRTVGGAAIFQTRSRRVEICSLDAMVEDDHAVGDVFLEAVARDRAAVALLAGDDRGHAAVLQPAEQAAQLGAQNGVIGQSGEQRLDRVEHHAFRADGIDRVPSRMNRPFEVVLAGLLDLAALDMDVVERRSFSAPRASPGRSRASATLAVSSAAFSSNIMNTPGSPNCVAPRTRNSMASIVLPHPAAPQTSVGRPAGSPPPVISSRPSMPVGAFEKGRGAVRQLSFHWLSNILWLHSNSKRAE